MSNRQIITQLNCDEIQSILNWDLKSSDKKVLIVKFTATWCGPCKRIKNDCYNIFNQLPSNILIADLDVDLEKNNIFYSFMKRKRMVNGIPVLMAWYRSNDRAFWYVPDDSVTGGDINAVKDFLQRVYQRSLSI